MNSTEINKARMEAYTKKHINDTAFAIKDEWDENKHPRAANGQFGSGGATSAPTKATKAPAEGNATPAAKKPAKAKNTVEIPKTAHHEDIFGGADGAKWEKQYKSYFKDSSKFMSDYTPEQLDKVLVRFKNKFDRAEESIVKQKKESPNVPPVLKQNYVAMLADYQAALKLRQAKG